jgi:hypothetical protein
MKLSNRDKESATNRCVRSAMVLIAWELDQLLATPDLRRWCSTATIQLLTSTQAAKQQKNLTRSVVLFARQVAERASARTWTAEETACA